MPRPSATRARFSHVGLCVDDVDRAKAFYMAAFGFVEGREPKIVNDQHGLLGVEGDYRLDMLSRQNLSVGKRPISVIRRF